MVMIRLNHINITYEKDLIIDSELVLENKKLTLITGESGSGKTSLLYMIGLIEKNTHVHYQFHQQSIDMGDMDLIARLRRYHIGYVFQENYMIEDATIYDNFEYMYRLVNKQFGLQDIQEMLDMVRLDKPQDGRVSQLSGGQKQRLAIALALCKAPDLLILDEPTSALDKKNSILMMEVLKNIVETKDMVVVMTSHSAICKEYADVVYEIKNKKLITSQEIEMSNQKEIVIKNKKNSFIPYYIRTQLKKNKKLYAGIFIVLALLISFMSTFKVFSSQYSEYKFNQEVYDNHITLTIAHQQKNNTQCYYLPGNPAFDQDVIDQISSIEGVNDINSYHHWSISSYDVDGVSVEKPLLIVPYYDDLKEEDIYSMLDNKQKVYISYDLYQDYKGSPIQFELFNETFDLGTKGVVSDYYKPLIQTEKGMSILYIPYEYVSSYLGESSVYQLEIETINQFNDIKSKINELDESTGFFSLYLENTEFIKEATLRINEMAKLFTVTIMILSIFFVALVYFKIISNRTHEICLLKANGLSNKQLTFMMILEWLIHILCIGVISIILLVCMHVILYSTLHFSFDILSISNLMFLFGYTLFTMFVPGMGTLYSIIKNSPAKLLRN